MVPDPPSAAPGEWHDAFRAQFEKTRMCHFYLQNKCRFGESCRFAHTPNEIKPPPVLDKTSVCVAWSQGNCPLSSDECKFAHGRSELRRTLQFERRSLIQFDNPMDL